MTPKSRSERLAGRPSCCPGDDCDQNYDDGDDGNATDVDDNDDLDDDIDDDDDDDDDDSHLCHKYLVELLSDVEVGGWSISHCHHLDWQLRNVH